MVITIVLSVLLCTLLVGGLLPRSDTNGERAVWTLVVSVLATCGFGGAALALSAEHKRAREHLHTLAQTIKGLETQINEIYKKLVGIENQTKKALEESAHARSLENRMQQVEHRLDDVVHKIPTLWIMCVQQGGNTQKHVLQTVAKTVKSIANGSEPGPELSDRDLEELIREIHLMDLVSSSDAEVQRLVFAIRDDVYRLSDSQFHRTRTALRESAEALLQPGPNDAVRLVRGYSEVVLHADQWSFAGLKKLEQKLRDATRRGVAQHLKKVVANSDSQHSLGCGLRSDGGKPTGRVWKRVWATETQISSQGWCELSCSSGGAGVCGCKCVLAELSLSGASCKTCTTKEFDKELELQLDLRTAGHVTIQKARFRPHGGQMIGQGERGDPGISIEFLEISDEAMRKLAEFIRNKTELNATKAPPSAPWLYSSPSK